MLRWLGRILKWKQTKGEADSPLVNCYGRYLHKPVVIRAITMIAGLSVEQVVEFVNSEDGLVFNGSPIPNVEFLNNRLESGQYEIFLPSENKVWQFFIL